MQPSNFFLSGVVFCLIALPYHFSLVLFWSLEQTFAVVWLNENFVKWSFYSNNRINQKQWEQIPLVITFFSPTVIVSLYWIAITLYRYQLGDWGLQNSCRSSTATWNQGNTWPFAAASSPAPGARGDWTRKAPWNGWRDNGDEPPFPRTGAWNPGRTPRRAHTCVEMSGAVKKTSEIGRGCNNMRLC